jgi:hypothetical protein
MNGRIGMPRFASLLSRTALAAAALIALLYDVHSARGQYFPDDRISCRSCHIDTRNKTDFCELFEATIYERDDKHGKAFFLLHETDPSDPQRGQAKRDLVRQILGFDLREAFADAGYARLIEGGDETTQQKVATVKACIRCHGTWPASADAVSPTQPPVALSLGVSCQACHGPGLRWNVAHYLPPHAWRTVAPEAKALLGFTDVRSPVKKAALCTSCHVGSISEGKLVKHEWYAGGHPPLPGFELASYQNQMPVHWKSLADKPTFAFRDGTLARDDTGIAANVRALRDAGIPENAIKANYLEANGIEPNAVKDISRTRDITVGGAGVLAAYVRLVGDYASLAAEGKAAWPELALYDCSACHHELRAGLAVTTRPKRKHVPGRPPPATWTAALAILAERPDSTPLSDQGLQLDRAMTERPFGKPQAIREAAQPLADALLQLATETAKSRYPEATAQKAVQLLTDPAHVEINDFYSARQVAWALRELAKDLNVRNADRLFLQGNDDPLCLALPSGPERSVMENLHRWLPAASQYNPAWFQKELQSVRSSISP